MNTAQTDTAVARVAEQFATGAIAWYVVFGLLVVFALVDFGRGIYSQRKRAIESKQFLLFCATVLIWSASQILLAVYNYPSNQPWLELLSDALKSFILVTLCLHVWSQVSYKPITVIVAARYLVVPVVLTVFAIVLCYYPSVPDADFIWESSSYGSAGLLNILYMGFEIVVISRAYLLCFNVFYQMPKHMRRSTHNMLFAISAIAVVCLFKPIVALSDGIWDSLFAISYIIALQVFFSAFFIANSANVIVTSREFVFASLSTVVITISLKGNILDWNKKGVGNDIALPHPNYKEPYARYRARIIETCNGVTSPHDENIITAMIDGVERHYLFTPHDIGFSGRNFGYLVEISEVTKSYAVLRYLEEIAMYDNLTGLMNRNAYIEMVNGIMKPENMPLGIIVGDVNNLKKTNDTLGHLHGDRLLTTVTDIINRCMPAGASVFRIGGDELVLLVPKADEMMLKQFVLSVTAVCELSRDEDYGIPSISWGHALVTEASQNYNEVFRVADAMMYDNKRKSKEISVSGIVDIASQPQPGEALD